MKKSNRKAFAAAAASGVVLFSICTSKFAAEAPIPGFQALDLLCTRIYAKEELEPDQVSKYALKPGHYYFMWNAERRKFFLSKKENYGYKVPVVADYNYRGVYVLVLDAYEDPDMIGTTRKVDVFIPEYNVYYTYSCNDYIFFNAPPPDKLIK